MGEMQFMELPGALKGPLFPHHGNVFHEKTRVILLPQGAWTLSFGPLRSVG